MLMPWPQKKATIHVVPMIHKLLLVVMLKLLVVFNITGGLFTIGNMSATPLNSHTRESFLDIALR